MTSSDRHPSRPGHALLLLGAVALLAVGLTAGLHASCDHDGEHRDCAVCRHLGDGAALTASITLAAAPAPVAAVAPAQVADIPHSTKLAHCGRAPPQHVSVS